MSSLLWSILDLYVWSYSEKPDESGDCCNYFVLRGFNGMAMFLRRLHIILDSGTRCVLNNEENYFSLNCFIHEFKNLHKMGNFILFYFRIWWKNVLIFLNSNFVKLQKRILNSTSVSDTKRIFFFLCRFHAKLIFHCSLVLALVPS